MLNVLLGDVRREIVDLYRAEQETQREYRRAVHYRRVTAERALCVHDQQRHLSTETLTNSPRSQIFPHRPISVLRADFTDPRCSFPFSRVA